MKQSTFVGTKPQATVLRSITAHDDIAWHAKTLFRKGLHRLQGLRIHLDDTTVITTQPVIALLVFCHRIDITYGQTLEVRQGLSTHGHTVLITGKPHTPQLIQIQVLDGNIRQRRVVALDIGKLAPLLVFKVEHQHTEVVSRHPEQPLRIVTDFPDQDVIRHILKASCPHQFRE